MTEQIAVCGYVRALQARLIAEYPLPEQNAFAINFKIEMKSKKGRLSEQQKDTHKIMKAAGITVYTCYSSEEALEAINKEIDIFVKTMN